MHLRAVTLDAGGTLFETAAPVGVTYARAATRHGMACEAGALEAAFRRAFAAAPPLAFPGASPSRLADHERAWWYAVVRDAFGAAARAPGFDPCFAELFEHYGRAEAWRVYPEVPAALGALRARGLRLAVVSNFDARLPGLIAGLGLSPLVDAVVHSTRAGAAKPDPAIFHDALHALGVGAAEALHAGDDPEIDVAGATGAGLRAVLVTRGSSAGGAAAGVPRVATLAALPGLLAELET